MEHFLKAKRLGAKLNLVFLFIANFSVLVFDGIKADRKLDSGDQAAIRVKMSLDTVAFSADPQCCREYIRIEELNIMSAALHARGVNTIVLNSALRGVRAFCPKLIVGQKRGSPQAISGM